jgi:protein-L-isoaspartate(D-aspartate) O-methyltransferase
MRDTFKHRGQRERLVKELAGKGIADEAVLEAIGRVPRHLFVESAFEPDAYTDKALPIFQGQTISQPYTVAAQTELLALRPRMKVLEIGTGSGYQAAVLAMMGMKVFSVEIHKALHDFARENLEELSLDVRLKLGDGSAGWAQYQPYERILVTAACPEPPQELLRQLDVNGILVAPIGNRDTQRMHVITRLGKQEYETRILQSFRFVPLTGKFGFKE